VSSSATSEAQNLVGSDLRSFARKAVPMRSSSHGSIYRPGVPSYPELGIYDNFPDAFAAAAYLAEPAVTLDPTYGSIEIPPGTYVLPTVFKLFGLNYATVQFNNGVVFALQPGASTTLLFDDLNVLMNKTDAPFISVVSDTNIDFISQGGCAFNSTATATQPMVSQSGTGFTYMDGQDNTTYGGQSSATPLFYNNGSARFEIIQCTWAILGPNVMSGSKFLYAPTDASCNWTKQQAATDIEWTSLGTIVAEVVATSDNPLSVPDSTPTTVTSWVASTNTSPDVTGQPFNATSGIFTAPISGSYLVQHSEEYAAPATAPAVGVEFTASIVKNSAVVAQQTAYSVGVATKVAVQVSETVVMAMGDTLQVQTSQNSGATQQLSGVAVRNRLSITYQSAR
jgi:hypothetical protein